MRQQKRHEVPAGAVLTESAKTDEIVS